MQRSIYQFTREKLLTHGVRSTADGSLTLTDKTLFLKFVKLERAVRGGDFKSVQNAVHNIQIYTENNGKRSLLLFVYMYLRFSDNTPYTICLDQPLANGGVRRIANYQREITLNERLIGDWTSAWYKNYSPAFFRAVYANK